MKIKTLLLYIFPFILTVLIAIYNGIPEILSFVAGWLFISIFMFGIPILVFCLPYGLYFFVIGKLSKKSIIGFLGTMTLLIMFLVVSAKVYKPIEDKIYFKNEVKTHLINQSLILFEEKRNMKGKVREVNKISKMEGWNDVEVSGLVEGRMFQIGVESTSKEDSLTIYYTYLYKDGEWTLKSEGTEKYSNYYYSLSTLVMFFSFLY